MSDLQEIALKVTKLVSDTSAFAAQLRSYAKAASLMNERLLSLMASTTQSSYQTISAQMQTAQKKILDAANMMDASSNTAGRGVPEAFRVYERASLLAGGLRRLFPGSILAHSAPRRFPQR